MTEKEQRIAIATACGYTSWVKDGKPTRLFSREAERKKHWLDLTELPDYLNDLNAMHEAEKVLDTLAENGSSRYRDILCGMLGWWWGHASAAQRAEAFLKTLDLWT